MINIIWPRKLFSPHISLGIPLENGLSTLHKLSTPLETNEDNEHSFKIETAEFDVAIYENTDIVTSVWYNDPLGRLWSKGKSLKINLYLQRYGLLDDWEMRLDNGWIRMYFNDKEGISMSYCIHQDVIRFNLKKRAE